MRRRRFVLAAVVGLAATACSDSNITHPSLNSGGQALRNDGTPADLNTQIHALIDSVFPSSLRSTATGKWDAVVVSLQGSGSSGPSTSSRQKLIAAVTYVQQKTSSLRPSNGETAAHAATRLVLDMSLFSYNGPSAVLPPIDIHGDAAFGIVSTSSASTIQTPSQHAAVAFTSGSVGEATVVVISQEGSFFFADCSGPLNTSLCQYPQFYHFDAFPDVKLRHAARVAVCAVNTGDIRLPLEDRSNFRLAHDAPVDPRNYVPGGSVVGGIEILPAVQVSDIMDCSAGDSYAAPITANTSRQHLGTQFDRARGKVAKLAPTGKGVAGPLSETASAAAEGGSTLFFSNFAMVDPNGTPDISIVFPMGDGQTSFTLSQTNGYPGDVLNVNPWHEMNFGTATGNGSNLYLATDPGLTAGVVALGPAAGPTSISPGSAADFPGQQVTIPGNLAPGTYYVGVRADDPNAIAGSTETNNVASVQVTVTNPSPTYTIADLGTFGGLSAQASAVNDHGMVVGWYVSSGGVTHAFAWTGGAFSDLGTLGGTSSSATGVNNLGEVVGASTTSTGEEHAFLWSATGGMRDLGTPGVTSDASQINDAGDIVGGTENDATGVGHALRWPARGAAQDLGPLGGTHNGGFVAVNQLGQALAVEDLSTFYTKAALWSPSGGLVQIPNLGSTDPKGGAIPVAMNNSGTVVGTSGVPNDEITGSSVAFMWTPGSAAAINLGTLGGLHSTAAGVNDLGTVVGNTTTSAGLDRHAFVWNRLTQMQPLPEQAGWSNSFAMAVNANGLIVGFAYPAGQAHVIVWTPSASQPATSRVSH